MLFFSRKTFFSEPNLDELMHSIKLFFKQNRKLIYDSVHNLYTLNWLSRINYTAAGVQNVVLEIKFNFSEISGKGLRPLSVPPRVRPFGSR